jgi:hypothetical protein
MFLIISLDNSLFISFSILGDKTLAVVPQQNQWPAASLMDFRHARFRMHSAHRGLCSAHFGSRAGSHKHLPSFFVVAAMTSAPASCPVDACRALSARASQEGTSASKLARRTRRSCRSSQRASRRRARARSPSAGRRTSPCPIPPSRAWMLTVVDLRRDAEALRAKQAKVGPTLFALLAPCTLAHASPQKAAEAANAAPAGGGK